MGCNCGGNCKNYGKPGCLCALRDQKALTETADDSQDLESE
ncbi:hypothetical protein [Methanocella arvoryzae]|nr:hypothetical protein [Methanocella arvoryzae]